jgi:hypothetical protein
MLASRALPSLSEGATLFAVWPSLIGSDGFLADQLLLGLDEFANDAADVAHEVFRTKLFHCSINAHIAASTLRFSIESILSTASAGVS